MDTARLLISKKQITAFHTFTFKITHFIFRETVGVKRYGAQFNGVILCSPHTAVPKKVSSVAFPQSGWPAACALLQPPYI